MVDKLYQRQGGNLSPSMGIIQPKYPTNTLSKYIKQKAVEVETLANENLALSRMGVLNNVLDTAYKTAPTNPKQFSELVESGLNKALEGIPEEYQKKFLLSVQNKIAVAKSQVEDNFISLQENEKINSITNQLNNDINGTFGLENNQESLIKAFIDGDQERFNILNNQNKEIYTNINKYVGEKNLKGNYIIGDNQVREALQMSNYGKSDAFKNQLSYLTAEELKNFHENTFQDKKGVINSLGITEKQYNDVDKYILDRIKKLDKEMEIEYKTQAQYDSARMVYDFNPELVDKLESEGFMPKKLKKEILKAQELKINPILAQDKTQNLAQQFSFLSEITNSDKITPEERLQVLADVMSLKNNFIELNGTDENTNSIIERAMVESVVDKNFNDKLKTTFDEKKAIGQLFNEVKQGTLFNIDTFLTRADSLKKNLKKMNTEQIEKFKSNFIKDEINTFSSQNKKAQLETAISGATLGMNYLIAARNPFLTDDKREEYYNEFNKIMDETNKKVIKVRYGRYISPEKFDEMEKQLKEGKKAYTNPINGIIYEFKGYTDDDILVATAK